MNALKIGDRQLKDDQIISALVQYKLLEPLVGQVLLDEVLRQIPLSEQELFRALGGAANDPVPEDFSGFVEQWCQQMQVTLAYFKGVILRELRVEKFKQLQFGHQVESEFLQKKSDLDQVEYLRLQLPNLAIAQELYFHLRDDGTRFESLAQYYSMGSERQTEGRVGPVSLSTLPHAVKVLFQSGQEGIIYGPIPIGDRFWIVKLERMIAARLTEVTRVHLINQLYTRWLQSQVTALVAQPGAVQMQNNSVGDQNDSH